MVHFSRTVVARARSPGKRANPSVTRVPHVPASRAPSARAQRPRRSASGHHQWRVSARARMRPALHRGAEQSRRDYPAARRQPFPADPLLLPDLPAGTHVVRDAWSAWPGSWELDPAERERRPPHCAPRPQGQGAARARRCPAARGPSPHSASRGALHAPDAGRRSPPERRRGASLVRRSIAPWVRRVRQTCAPTPDAGAPATGSPNRLLADALALLAGSLTDGRVRLWPTRPAPRPPWCGEGPSTATTTSPTTRPRFSASLEPHLAELAACSRRRARSSCTCDHPH